jgi:hypothetical protein
VSKDDRVPEGGPSDPDVDIVGASGSVPASPEPSLKKPFRGFLAGDDGAARYMRLKRETPPSDTPLTAPPRWLPDPQLIELRRKEHQALRELHAFLMGMHDDRIRRETLESGPGRNNKQADDDEQVQGLLNKHDRNVEAARREFVKLHPDDTGSAASKRFTRSVRRIRERDYYKSKRM